MAARRDVASLLVFVVVDVIRLSSADEFSGRHLFHAHPFQSLQPPPPGPAFRPPRHFGQPPKQIPAQDFGSETFFEKEQHWDTRLSTVLQNNIVYRPEHDDSREGSGCRINGKLYRVGDHWYLPDCRRGTCVKFGHNYYVSEDRCRSTYYNSQYACVIYEDKGLQYPHCCPKYKCNPER